MVGTKTVSTIQNHKLLSAIHPHNVNRYYIHYTVYIYYTTYLGQIDFDTVAFNHVIVFFELFHQVTFELIVHDVLHLFPHLLEALTMKLFRFHHAQAIVLFAHLTGRVRFATRLAFGGRGLVECGSRGAHGLRSRKGLGRRGQEGKDGAGREFHDCSNNVRIQSCSNNGMYVALWIVESL